MVSGVREGTKLAWRGIPYAAPPVGELRFRAPRPVVPWEGIRDASKFGKVAPQLHNGQFRGAGPRILAGEDCLTINVLSAGSSSREPPGLPVMVFIHGGGYSAGSSQDFPGQGETFVQSGQVLYVSFNYRLGVFGYLDFSQYSTPIDLLTLTSASATRSRHWSGCTITSPHSGRPAQRDRVRRIGGRQRRHDTAGHPFGSGTIRARDRTEPTGGRRLPPRPGRRVGRGICHGAPHGNGPVSRRRGGVPWQCASSRPRPPPSSRPPPSPFSIRSPDANPGTFCLAPVVDGVFLPERPMDAFRSGRAQRLPLIIGTNDREGTIFRGRIDILPRSPARIRALIMQAPASSHRAMRKAYPGLPARRPAADFAGDFAFWYPSVMVADLHSRFAPVHVYRFDVAPRMMRVLGLDATHGIELFALFDRVDTPFARSVTALGGREQFAEAGRRMRHHWLAFARGGTVADSWPAYEQAERLTLVIDQIDRVESDPRREKREAWAAFLPDP